MDLLGLCLISVQYPQVPSHCVHRASSRKPSDGQTDHLISRNVLLRLLKKLTVTKDNQNLHVSVTVNEFFDVRHVSDIRTMYYFLLIPWNRVLHKLTVVELVKKLTPFYETSGSFVRLQEPSYAEPYESSLRLFL